MAIFSGRYKILNEKDVPIDDDDEYELNQAPTTDDDEDDYEVQDEDVPEDEELEGDDEEDAEEENVDDDLQDEEEDEPQGEEVDDEDNYELEPDSDLEDDEDQGEETTDNEVEDEPQEEDELEQLEKELFKNLKQEEISIRDNELKQNYVSLYYNICNLSDRIETVPKREHSIDVLTFASNKLQEIKGTLYAYTINNYHLNTYIENNKNYLLYLAFLNKISLLLDQINEKDLP